MAARVHHTKKHTYRTASNVVRKLRTPGNINPFSFNKQKFNQFFNL